MNKIKTLVVGALLLSAFIIHPTQVRAEWISKLADSEPLKKADLPTGGTFVEDPTNKQKSYYHLDFYHLRIDPSNKDKYAGLYGSVDGGKTFKRLEGQFEYHTLFIHPKTGELFALIEDDFLYADEDGILAKSFRMMKAIHSVDGQRWKNITGKRQHYQSLTGISLDPENPSRVRLSGHAFRGFWLIASDDQYSSWKQVTIPYGPPF